MKITVNGVSEETSCKTAFEYRDSHRPGCGTFMDGFALRDDIPLREGTALFFLSDPPSPEEVSALRHSREPHIRGILKETTVGVAGLGGLGSNICWMLARSGVGRLVIADRDRVDPTNLGRQNYDLTDLSLPKTEAVLRKIKAIDPDIVVETFLTEINENNAAEIFGKCDVICEALDSPGDKAAFVNRMLLECPGATVICGSGMSGRGNSNLIKTERRFRNLYVCGDGLPDDGTGLTAARVCICAGHMANAAVEATIEKKGR